MLISCFCGSIPSPYDCVWHRHERAAAAAAEDDDANDAGDAEG